MRIQHEIHGITFTVDYKVSGSYYPGTRETPAEQPDIEVTHIWIVEGDCLVEVNDDILSTKVYDELWEKVSEQV